MGEAYVIEKALRFFYPCSTKRQKVRRRFFFKASLWKILTTLLPLQKMRFADAFNSDSSDGLDVDDEGIGAGNIYFEEQLQTS